MLYFSTLLGFLCALSYCSCEQRLLIDQLKWDFLTMENELWNFSANGLLFKTQNDAEIYIAKKFNEFDQKLTQIPQNLLYGADPLKTIPDFLFLYSEMKIIDTTYEKFREYLSRQLNDAKDKISIEDMIYDITNNKTGVDLTTRRVYEHAINVIRGASDMIVDNYWCKNPQQSPQQLRYNLYNLLVLNELKSYVLQQFALLGNRLWEEGINVELSIAARKNFEKRSIILIRILGFGGKVPQDIWRCDPKAFVKGQNYDEFTRLLQGHIQNEVDMSSRRTCRETCSEYSYTKSHGCYDYESDICRKVERCNGNIIGCFFVESHASICLSSSPSRRYDYIRYKSGRTLGKNTNCPNRKTVNSWTRWFVRCHYCMCLCDEQGPKSDRYINLRPAMADIKMNRVVTGIRLIKHNRILHVQIQEGQLLPYGYINQSTVRWVPVDDYKITDTGVKNREDFFTLSYGDRSMAMDEIQVNDDNHVVTGVGFLVRNNMIHFQIHVSPFDWHSGALNETTGYYIYETNRNVRTKIDIKKSDIPTNKPSDKPSQMVHSNANLYVEFTHTDFYKDVAQTTVPFMDLQEVITQPAVPLMGLGIYYKGTAGYGGFIAPRIKTYNYGQHVSEKMPSMGDRKEVARDPNEVEVN